LALPLLLKLEGQAALAPVLDGVDLSAQPHEALLEARRQLRHLLLAKPRIDDHQHIVRAQSTHLPRTALGKAHRIPAGSGPTQLGGPRRRAAPTPRTDEGPRREQPRAIVLA